MRILNVIEQNDAAILSCRSFVIKDTSASDEKKITEAEQHFIACARENGIKSTDEETTALEDGYFETDDQMYAVKLVWSDPVI